MTPTPVTGFGLYAQRGINLLQVGALRLPCLMASVAAIARLAELSLRGVSATLAFIGFNENSTFSQWVTRGVDYVRPYKNEIQYPTKDLILQTLALAAVGIVGNAFVNLLFGPPPAIYNAVLQWIGPVGVVPDYVHPVIQFAANRL